MDFIGNANSERRAAGVDANASTNLEAEYDRRHPVAEILAAPRDAEPETVHDNLPWCCILGRHGGEKS